MAARSFGLGVWAAPKLQACPGRGLLRFCRALDNGRLCDFREGWRGRSCRDVALRSGKAQGPGRLGKPQSGWQRRASRAGLRLCASCSPSPHSARPAVGPWPRGDVRGGKGGLIQSRPFPNAALRAPRAGCAPCPRDFPFWADRPLGAATARLIPTHHITRGPCAFALKYLHEPCGETMAYSSTLPSTGPGAECDTEQGPVGSWAQKPLCVPISCLQEIGFIQPPWPSLSSKEQVQLLIREAGDADMGGQFKRNNSAALGQGPGSPSRDTHNSTFELFCRYWNLLQVGEVNCMLPTGTWPQTGWNQKVGDADSYLPFHQPIRRVSTSWSHPPWTITIKLFTTPSRLGHIVLKAVTLCGPLCLVKQ